MFLEIEACELECSDWLVELACLCPASPKLRRDWVLAACQPVPSLSPRTVAHATLQSWLRLNSASWWKTAPAHGWLGGWACSERSCLELMEKSRQGWPGQRVQEAVLESCSRPVVLAHGVEPFSACLLPASLTKRVSLRLREGAPHSGGGGISLWVSHHPPKMALSPPFIDGKTEAERGDVTSSRPHSRKEEDLGYLQLALSDPAAQPPEAHSLRSWALPCWACSGRGSPEHRGSSFCQLSLFWGSSAFWPQLRCASSRQPSLDALTWDTLPSPAS